MPKLGDANLQELDWYRNLAKEEVGTTMKEYVAKFECLRGPYQK